MKKLIYISAICVCFVFLLGMAIPIAVYCSGTSTFIINTKVLYVYAFIFSVCISFVVGTIFSLIKYAPKIEHLEKEEIKIDEEKRKLQILIQKYNSLIIEK